MWFACDLFFFFSSRRRHTRLVSDWSSDVCSSDLHGDQLCVGGVGFTDRTITLLKGLPAKDGETLAANADAPFTSGDKPPYVGFAGQEIGRASCREREEVAVGERSSEKERGSTERV